MKALTVRTVLVAMGAVAAGTLVATPAVADAGPAVINARCDDRLVSQPAEIIPNCSDQSTTLTGLRWLSWAGDHATGFGNQQGPRGSGPVFVMLDQPAVQMTGQSAFTHATVNTASGAQEQFAIAPMWAQ